MDGWREKLIDGLPTKFYCLNKPSVWRWISFLPGRHWFLFISMKSSLQTWETRRREIIHHNKRFNHRFFPPPYKCLSIKVWWRYRQGLYWRLLVMVHSRTSLRSGLINKLKKISPFRNTIKKASLKETAKTDTVCRWCSDLNRYQIYGTSA